MPFEHFAGAAERPRTAVLPLALMLLVGLLIGFGGGYVVRGRQPAAPATRWRHPTGHPLPRRRNRRPRRQWRDFRRSRHHQWPVSTDPPDTPRQRAAPRPPAAGAARSGTLIGAVHALGGRRDDQRQVERADPAHPQTTAVRRLHRSADAARLSGEARRGHLVGRRRLAHPVAAAAEGDPPRGAACCRAASGSGRACARCLADCTGNPGERRERWRSIRGRRARTCCWTATSSARRPCGCPT